MQKPACRASFHSAEPTSLDDFRLKKVLAGFVVVAALMRLLHRQVAAALETESACICYPTLRRRLHFCGTISIRASSFGASTGMVSCHESPDSMRMAWAAPDSLKTVMT